MSPTVDLAPSPEAAAPPPAEERAAPPWQLALVPVLLIAIGGLVRAWIADDGLINVRIIEVLVDGHGPTYTPGIRTETATSPGWALVLAVARLIGLPADAASVWLGLVGTVVGMGLAARAALTGARRRVGETSWVAWPLPLGLIAYASVGFAWDFTTSGLENGLVTLWLGAVALTLNRGRTDRPWSRRGRAVLFGLGPILRPEMALVSALLLIADLRRPEPGRWAKVRGLAWAAALPVAVQVGRMAVYGVLVPNTGLAKEGTTLRPGQGLRYLGTSLTASGAWILVLLVASVLVVARRSAAGRSEGAPSTDPRTGPSATAVLAVAGAVHLGYVVLIGGDFMLGRLLLPGLFLLATACGATPLPALPRHRAVLAVGLAGFVLVALAGDRPMTGDIADERAVYARFAGDARPVSAKDHDDAPYARIARLRLGDAGPGTLVVLPRSIDGEPVVMPLDPAVADRFDNVLVTPVLGTMAAVAGPDVAVLDPIGLADPVASHQELVDRGKPGHEKWLSPEWYVARFADPDAPLAPGLDPARVDAARRALGCGTMADLVEATSGELTWSQAVANIADAPRLTAFRFHPDPLVAVDELC